MNRITRFPKQVCLSISFSAGLLIVACNLLTSPSATPTLPADVQQLCDLVLAESLSGTAPYFAIEKLVNMYPNEACVVTSIMPALQYKGDKGSSISMAAQALGQIGPGAAEAVPLLVATLENVSKESSTEAQFVTLDLVIALGRIGPAAKRVIPILVELVYREPSPYVAWSISQIVQQEWPNSDAKIVYQAGVPELDTNILMTAQAQPAIVDLAREWWENDGQYQEWGEPTEN